MVSLGISFAVTALVGNSIGAQDVPSAKKYSIVALLTGMSVVTLTTILVAIFKRQIPYVYTAEADVAQLFAELLDIYVYFAILDSAQIIMHGIIKGLGMQIIASAIALIILYPFNVPFAYFLGFYMGYGVVGLWYSQLCTVILLAVCYFVIIMVVDWDYIAKECLERFKQDKVDICKGKIK